MNQEEYENYMAQGYMQNQNAERDISKYAPQMQEQVSQAQAVLVAQTNPSNVLEDISMKLRGKVKNYDGTFLVEGDPVMNDKGINRMLLIMSGFINQGTVLSHLEEKQISKIVIQLGDDVVDDLTLNWKDYNIKDKMMLDHITDLIVFTAFFALNRALGQNEKNWLGRISLEHISGGPRMPSPKKESIFSKLRL